MASVVKELDNIVGDVFVAAEDRCVRNLQSVLRSVREFVSSIELDIPEELGDALVNSLKHLQKALNKYRFKTILFWLIFSSNISREIGEAMRDVTRSLQVIQSSAQLSEQAGSKFTELIQRMEEPMQVEEDVKRFAPLIEGPELDLKGQVLHFCKLLDLNPETDKEQLYRELRRMRSDANISSELPELQKRLLEIVDNILASQSGSVELSQADDGEALPLFDAFECPLTRQVMEDPVVLQSEHTYERRAIEQWFKTCRERNRQPTCPVSGTALTSTELLPNLVLRKTIEEWYQRNVLIRINVLKQKLMKETKEDAEVALDEILRLSGEKRMNKYQLTEAKLIPHIAKLWSLANASALRSKALLVLDRLATYDIDNQLAMVEEGMLKLAVKSLGSKVQEESENGAKLLFHLSEQPEICSKLAYEKGAIIHLDKLTNSESTDLSRLAEVILRSIEQDSNVIAMADAGRFQPLLSRLCTGSEDTQVEMAKYIAKGLSVNRVKELCAKSGSSVLVEMLSQGLDAKEASLGALITLSSLEANIPVLIKAGLLPPLLDLMFNIQSSLNARSLKLKESAAGVLADLVSQPGYWERAIVDEEGNTLASEQVVHNTLGLLAHAKPEWKVKLLQVLLGLASSPEVGAEVCKQVCSGNGLEVLLPLLQASDSTHRIHALEVLGVLSLHVGQDVVQALEQSGELRRFKEKLTSGCTKERAAGAWLVSRLPLSREQIAVSLQPEVIKNLLERLLEANKGRSSTKQGRSSTIAERMNEGLLGTLAHIAGSEEQRFEQELWEQRAMVALLKQLESPAQSTEAKQRALTALRHMSDKAQRRSPAAPPPARWRVSWPAAWLCGGSAVAVTPPCRVHGGACSSAGFCLVAAGGVDPLVDMLEDSEELEVRLAAAEALATLMSDTVASIRGGVEEVRKAEGLGRVLQLLRACEGRPELQERVLWIVERVLRFEEFSKPLSVDPSLFKSLVDAFKHGSVASRALAQEALTNLKQLSGISASKKSAKP